MKMQCIISFAIWRNSDKYIELSIDGERERERERGRGRGRKMDPEISNKDSFYSNLNRIQSSSK